MNVPVAVARAQSPVVLRLVMFSVPVVLALAPVAPGEESSTAEKLLMWTLAAGLALLFWMAPRRLAYSLCGSELRLRLLTTTKRIPLAGAKARTSAGRLGIRTFGTGLPGYLSGQFTFGPDTVGRVFAAASRADQGVIVEAGKTHYFLTPADPAAFLAELGKRGAIVAG